VGGGALGFKYTPGFTVFRRMGSRKWRMTASVSLLVSPLTGVPLTSSSTSPLQGTLPAWQTIASENVCPRWGNSPSSAPPSTSSTATNSPEPPHDRVHSCTLVDQCFFFSVLDIVGSACKPGRKSENDCPSTQHPLLNLRRNDAWGYHRRLERSWGGYSVYVVFHSRVNKSLFLF